MASTNKTTNYELSQYIGTDKPTYLTDYNQDMSKIDSGIHAAKSEADTNSTSIGTLSNLTTDTKSSLVGAINEVDAHSDTNASNIATNTSNIATNTTHIGTLTNLTTASKTDLVVAANEINAKVGDISALNTTVKSSTVAAINEVLNEFNFTATELDPDKYVFSLGYREGGSIKVAKNSTGTLCKIYGDLRVACGPNIPFTITTGDTGLRPTSEIFIEGLNYCYQINDHTVDKVEVYLQTDGKVRINMATRSTAGTIINIIPCLIFVKDFGDVPVQQ
jgi:hypothetical protein